MSVRKFSQILPILLDKERGEIDGLTIFQILKLTYHVTWHIVCVWIQCLLRFAFVFFLFFFFSSSAACVFRRTNFTVLWTVIIIFDFLAIFSLKINPTTLFWTLKPKFLNPNRTVQSHQENLEPLKITIHLTSKTTQCKKGKEPYEPQSDRLVLWTMSGSGSSSHTYFY